jgi:hypothetical protein
MGEPWNPPRDFSVNELPAVPGLFIDLRFPPVGLNREPSLPCLATKCQ